jgi:hypothetical protein
MSDTDRKRVLESTLNEAHDLAYEARRELIKAGVTIHKGCALDRLIRLLSGGKDLAKTDMVEAAEMRLDKKSWKEISDAMGKDVSHYRNAKRLKPIFDETLETVRYFREAAKEIFDKRK